MRLLPVYHSMRPAKEQSSRSKNCVSGLRRPRIENIRGGIRLPSPAPPGYFQGHHAKPKRLSTEKLHGQGPRSPGYGFSGTVSGLPISLMATTRTLAGSVLLALLDTAWSWPGAS